MSEELATVVAIEGDHAWVECERRSACSGCQQQSNCGTGTVAKAFPLKAPRLRVRLTAEVRIGQQVRLGIPQESL
ncbi:MAG: SoxR reducing system RseC family protein, partial [Aeromonas veronii]